MPELQLLTTPKAPAPTLRPMRVEGSRVVVYLDDTGASVAADVPVDDFKRMSASVKTDVDGRPHLEAWCNRHGRVSVPVTLLDLNGVPVPPMRGEIAPIAA
jgi:hypothetical protein